MSQNSDQNDTLSYTEEELLAIGDENNESIDFALSELENIVFSSEFTKMQDEYFGRYCHLFEDNEENQLYYTDIFNEYGQLLDEYLSSRLKSNLPSFHLKAFASWLLSHEDEIAGDVVDMVHSAVDFLQFKDTMLEYKKRCETKNEGEVKYENEVHLSIRPCSMRL